jgi:type VI secretion system secreted protein VgrG
MNIDNQLKSQQAHLISWQGAIADDLLLVALQGKEYLSSPYRYELHSVTTADETKINRWHGENISCCIGDGHENTPQRFVHGVVTHIRYIQRTDDDAECILTLEPGLSLLKMGRVMRVWQNIPVPELVRTLLKECGIEQLDLQLRNTYPSREYCIQYRESVFDFVHRLLEEEGIYYFFRHTASGHTMVLADHPSSHQAISGGSLTWHHQAHNLSQESVRNWGSSSSLIPGAVSLQGFSMSQAAPVNERQTALPCNTNADAVTFSDITPHPERSQVSRQAKLAMVSREANARLYDATVNVHWLSSGEFFTLKNHPSGEKKYRIQSLTIDAANNVDNKKSYCLCQLQAMSHDLPWYPPALRQPPDISGVLTATVVGPASEEIHTDEYGRIKIQFPWDNASTKDDTSSCWVRVTQPWSGGKFGGQFIPRIGSEVLVSFIQGHPDYPLVTGTVYNGQNKPPFSLPADKNESGFVTRSTSKSSLDEGHRLSFNDKKGDEKLTVVAQKDLLLTVKNDALYTIEANRSTELSKGNDRLVLKEGDVSVTLNKGNWQQDVSGDVKTDIRNGNYALNVTGGGGGIKTDKILSFESMQSIEFKVGTTKITLTHTGITLSSTKISIESSGNAELTGMNVSITGNAATALKGTMVSIEGSGNTEVKGAMTTISGSGMTQISGPMIMIG